MQEKLIVFNTTNNNISLVMFPSMHSIDVSGLAQHHSRRRIRAAKMNVSIPRAQSVDLVAATNMSIKELRNNPELNAKLRLGSLRVLEETHIIDIDDADIEIIEEPQAEAPMVTKSLDNFNALMDALDKEAKEPVEKIVEIIEEPGNFKVGDEVKPPSKPKWKPGRPKGSSRPNKHSKKG